MTTNITIQWDDDKDNLIVCNFKNDWTWHECREAMQIVSDMHSSVEFPVSYVYDFSACRLSGRTLAENLKKLIQLQFSPKPHKIIWVDKGQTLSLMMDSLAAMMPEGLPENLLLTESLLRARTLV